MNSTYNCETLKQLLEMGGVLIDVRSSFEFAQGALKGALNIPLESFQHMAEDINNDVPVLLYCRSGTRSEFAKRYLQQLGFDEVHNIGSYNQLAFCQMNA